MSTMPFERVAAGSYLVPHFHRAMAPGSAERQSWRWVCTLSQWPQGPSNSTAISALSIVNCRSLWVEPHAPPSPWHTRGSSATSIESLKTSGAPQSASEAPFENGSCNFLGLQQLAAVEMDAHRRYQHLRATTQMGIKSVLAVRPQSRLALAKRSLTSIMRSATSTATSRTPWMEHP